MGGADQVLVFVVWGVFSGCFSLVLLSVGLRVSVPVFWLLGAAGLLLSGQQCCCLVFFC